MIKRIRNADNPYIRNYIITRLADTRDIRTYSQKNHKKSNAGLPGFGDINRAVKNTNNKWDLI